MSGVKIIAESASEELDTGNTERVASVLERVAHLLLTDFPKTKVRISIDRLGGPGDKVDALREPILDVQVGLRLADSRMKNGPSRDLEAEEQYAILLGRVELACAVLKGTHDTRLRQLPPEDWSVDIPDFDP